MQLDVTHHLLSLRKIVVFTMVSLGRIRMPSNLFSLMSQASIDAEFDEEDGDAIGLELATRVAFRFFVTEVSVSFCSVVVTFYDL